MTEIMNDDGNNGGRQKTLGFFSDLFLLFEY